jgi:hypothetical protein
MTSMFFFAQAYDKYAFFAQAYDKYVVDFFAQAYDRYDFFLLKPMTSMGFFCCSSL